MTCRGVHFTLRADQDDRLLAARDDDFDYTWSNLQDPCAFFAKAAAAGRSVVFTVSQ